MLLFLVVQSFCKIKTKKWNLQGFEPHSFCKTQKDPEEILIVQRSGFRSGFVQMIEVIKKGILSLTDLNMDQ